MNSLREALTPIAARFGTPVREHEVLRVAATVSSGEGMLEAAREEVIRWAQRRCGGKLPAEAWEHQSFEFIAGGRNSAAVRIENGGTDIWAIRAEDPDKRVAGRVWTTEVVVATDGQGPSRFAARLLANTTEEMLDIEPHTPGFVQQITENCGLFMGKYGVDAVPTDVVDDADAEQFIDMLVNPERDFPVIALSCAPSTNAPLLDANALARSLLGMTRVAVLSPRACWIVTERLGRLHSLYGGAVRTYLPGYAEGCSPYSHRLTLSHGLATPEARRALEKQMRGFVARASLMRTTLGRDVLTFSTVKRAAIRAEQSTLQESQAPAADQLEASRAALKVQDERISELENDLEFFSDEHKRAEDRAARAEQLLAAANFRIGQLTDVVQQRGEEVDADIPLPESWGAFGDWCDTYLVGRVVLSSKARRQVRDPKYDDVETAARCVIWLANECRSRRMGGGDGTLGEMPVLDGVRHAHCGGDAFDFDWQGQRFTADWHIKNGGNTHDPRRCLRIYYAWDESSQLIIVAEMPAHIRTAAT